MTTPNIQIKEVLLKRGNVFQVSTYTGIPGEVVINTDTKTLHVQDGITVGGWPLATRQQVLTIANLVANTSIKVGNAPPVTSTTGTLWYDSEGGRTYIRYDDTWVDASPSVTDRSIVDIIGNVTQLQTDLAEVITNTSDYFGYIGTYVEDMHANAEVLTTNFNAYKTYANANAVTITTRAQTISANLGAYQTYANTKIDTLVHQSATTGANLVAYQTYANANVRALAYQVRSLDANVGRILLYENSTSGGGANVTVNTDPPIVNRTGSLWWDTQDGRLYLRYNDTWVDASPAIPPTIGIGATYASGAFQQLTLADAGKLITIGGGNSLLRLPQITANSLGAEFEFYFSADAGQVYLQAYYTDNRATTDLFRGSVFVGVDNSAQGRLHTATAGVADANYLFLGQHHARAGSYIRFKAIAFDGVGTWLVQGQCVGDTVNTTPNGQSYIFQNYYD
jgi:hypothetical protein